MLQFRHPKQGMPNSDVGEGSKGDVFLAGCYNNGPPKPVGYMDLSQALHSNWGCDFSRVLQGVRTITLKQLGISAPYCRDVPPLFSNLGYFLKFPGTIYKNSWNIHTVS